MIGAAPAVSVIVPCRNEGAHIETCVRSILEQEAPAGDLEVIVADGMSDDGTRDLLDRLAAADPRLRIVDNLAGIVSTGLNAAIRAARGRIILRMDAHTAYAPDYVRQCVAVLQETGADNVGGPWVARGEGYVGRAVAAAFQSPFGVGGARNRDPDYEGAVDTVYLGCWRREIFDWIGLFDEQLVRNQDDEFNLRLTRAGGKIWQSPRIRSWYRPRASLPALFRQYMQYGYWKVRVIQKHRMPASVRHLVPAMSVLTLAFLALAAIVAPLAQIGLAFAVAAYVCVLGLASGLAAARARWTLFPALPPVFVCFHVSWGIGFVRGMLDFLCKRAFDVLLSSVGLVLLSPLLGLIALLVRLTSPGPAFYGSVRLGLGGEPFTMLKFRTMVNGADRVGPLVTAGDDPRITPIGRYLRRTKLDELPTLWNVLTGDMSIVGPRPENPRSAMQYSAAQKRIWEVKPGITSLATLRYRHEERLLAGAADLEAAYYHIMQHKLALELEYIERQSFWLDLKIVVQTLGVVVR